MASRTLLQLIILTLIYIEAIEVRAFNKTNNFENSVNNISKTSDEKRSEKGNKSDKNYDQKSRTNLEAKCDILISNKHNFKNNNMNNEDTDSDKSQEQESDENMTSNTIVTTTTEVTSLYNRKQFSNEKKNSEHADDNSNNRILVAMGQKLAVEKIEPESATELQTNDDSYLKNNAGRNRPTAQRSKRLTIKHHNTKLSPTEALTASLLTEETTHRWATEVNNDVCKMKHCDHTHRSFEKISGENDLYRLKRRDDTKIVLKHANKLKRYSKSNRSFKRITLQENMSQSKHSDHSNSDTISKENENYKQEELEVSVEGPVSQQKPKRQKKVTHTFQKKNKFKMAKNVIDKTKNKSKIMHRFDRIKSKKDKRKPAIVIKTETHTDLRNGDTGSIHSEDTLIPNEAGTQTHENHVMNETQDSSQEILSENEFPNKAILPFYVSTTTTTNKFVKKSPIQQDAQKDEKKDSDILLDGLNTILKGNSDLKNNKIDINKTIDSLTSSKLLDFITDRVAGHMLKKFQDSQAFRNNFRTEYMKPEQVEHIDILFKKNGDMVMMSREKEHELV